MKPESPFTAGLPASRPATPSAGGNDEAASAVAGNFRLLVVDDDISAIQQLGKLLSGYAQVSFATNGESALSMASTQRPDLILLDAEMPGMHGFEVFKALQKGTLTADIPVVFATSHTAPAVESAVLRLGAADFLSKPFVASQVLARIRAQLQRRDRDPMQALPGDARRLKLLIVDDDVAMIQKLQHLLADVGECYFALDGAQALRLVASVAPDLVLLDIDMPGTDGFEICRRLRADVTHQHVPVVFVTQHVGADNEARAFAHRADDFISKNADASVLLARVRRLVDRKRQTDTELEAVRERDRVDTLSPDRSEAAAVGPGNDEMLSFIAHETGHAVNEVLGMSRLALADEARVLPAEQALRVNRIQDRAVRLQGLMQDVLDLGHLQAGRLRVESCEIDPACTVRGVCAELASQAGLHGVTLTLQSAPASTIRADPLRLHQCLANLVTHAIQYGGRDGRVHVGIHERHDEIAISVRDDGPGLTAAERARLFEPCSRLAREGSTGQGIGLGLLLTRALTVAMGGRLEVESEPGAGCCFSLRFARPGIST